MKTYKIVLTGGPCGGKTSSLNYFTKMILNDGMSVAAISETANFLLSLGFMPNVNISVFDFQDLLFKLQFIKEYKQEGKTDVLLCDRGLLDGKGYIFSDEFKKILEINNVSERLILTTYAAALYMRTIAYEFQTEFQLKRKYETPELGIARDKKCLDIWNSLILNRNLNDFDSLKNKQIKLYAILKEFLKRKPIEETYNLSDYYSCEHINFMCSGVNDILEHTDISEETKQITRRIIK